jgi:hypothetical protein
MKLVFESTWLIATVNTAFIFHVLIGFILIGKFFSDAVRHRFTQMEEALPKNSREKYIDESILHLTIHDCVLHALKTRRFVRILCLSQVN